MIFDLVNDFADVLGAMPEGHPRRRILKLIDEAIRRDVHFIDRHPTTLFQCMWNTCWWYDCPEAAKHYEKSEREQSSTERFRSGRRMSGLLENWQREKQTEDIESPWFRTLRPPAVNLGSTQRGILRGHKGDVGWVGWCAKGEQIVSASVWDGTIRIWREVGEPLRVEHKSGTLALSPDGTHIAVGRSDGTINVLDVETGHDVFISETGVNAFNSLAFSPDGRSLACCDRERIEIRDVQTGRVSRSFDISSGAVNDGIEWFPDGSRIAVNVTHHIEIVDSETGERRETLRVSRPFCSAIAVSADGRWLAAATGVHVQLWNLAQPLESRQLDGHTDLVSCVAFSHDSSMLASGSHDCTIGLWDVNDGEQIRSLQGHEQLVCSVCFSPDDSRIASGAGDWSVRLWQIDGDPSQRLRGHTGQVMGIAWAPDGAHFASGSSDGSLRLWDSTTGRQAALATGHTGGITCVAYSPDGRRIATSSRDGTVRLWNVLLNLQFRVLRGHGGTVGCVAFSPDGNCIASGGSSEHPQDYSVRIWSARRAKELLCLSGHISHVNDVAFSPDGRRLASGSHDETVRVWDSESGRELHRLHHPGCNLYRVGFLARGNQMFSAAVTNRSSATAGTIRIWDTSTGECLQVLEHQGNAHALNSNMQRAGIRPDPDDLYTVFRHFETGEAVGWYPAPIDWLSVHPTQSRWVGSIHNYVLLLELERSARTDTR